MVYNLSCCQIILLSDMSPLTHLSPVTPGYYLMLPQLAISFHFIQHTVKVIQRKPLLTTPNNIYHGIDNGFSTLAVALTISTAFDTTDHNTLLSHPFMLQV